MKIEKITKFLGYSNVFVLIAVVYYIFCIGNNEEFEELSRVCQNICSGVGMIACSIMFYIYSIFLINIRHNRSNENIKTHITKLKILAILLVVFPLTPSIITPFILYFNLSKTTLLLKLSLYLFFSFSLLIMNLYNIYLIYQYISEKRIEQANHLAQNQKIDDVFIYEINNCIEKQAEILAKKYIQLKKLYEAKQNVFTLLDINPSLTEEKFFGI